MTLHHCPSFYSHGEERSDAAVSYLVLRGGRPVCWVNN
jgi:hypothetical protein